MQFPAHATVEELMGLFSVKLGIGCSKRKLQKLINLEPFGRFQWAVTNDFTIWLHHEWHHTPFQTKQGIAAYDLWYEGNIHTTSLFDLRYIVVQFKTRSPFGYYAQPELQKANIRGLYACEMKILDYLEPLHTHPNAAIRRPYLKEDLSGIEMSETIPSSYAVKK